MQSGTPFPGSRCIGFALFILVMAHLAACASALSRETLRQISPDISSRDVLDDPNRHIGQTVLVAGSLLRTENRKEGTRLEILGYPTTSRGFPDTSEPALGRFLLLYPGYLDPLVYQPGRRIAAAGRVVGQHPVTIGESVHPEPLLHSLELRLLPEHPSYYSPFHIGVGFMFGF
jgi:outer membrane lipoprotein